MAFDAVVFSGGGCRCFWQAGFWSVVAPELELRPRAITGASAGSAFACAAVGGRLPEVIEVFTRRTAANPRNVYPTNVVRRRPLFPHYEIYRSTILETMDAALLEALREGPEVRVLLGLPPEGRRLASALLAGFVGYKVDMAMRRRVHPSLPSRLGFRPVLVSVRDCEGPHELADLILQSSALPPILPLGRRRGQRVIDGGIVDGALVDALDEHDSTLVMLTKPRPSLPRHPRRLYVQPSRPVPIAMWDYASPQLIGPTFDLGRRDGEAFLAERRSAGAPRSRAT